MPYILPLVCYLEYDSVEQRLRNASKHKAGANMFGALSCAAFEEHYIDVAAISLERGTKLFRSDLAQEWVSMLACER